MYGYFLHFCKRLIFGLLILGCGSSVLSAQTVINQYARVLTRSANQVTVDDISAFNAGDYVLIIQMQGVAIDASNSPSYGTAPNQLVGIPGRYEFLKIQNVTVATKTISFYSNIYKYDPAGNVQILKVPFYSSLTTSDVLTCKPWDRTSKTGGVLALIVGNTLTLNHDIDVSGKGFAGGRDTIGAGICSTASGIWGTYSFPRTFLNAGYKGEGLGSHQSFCSDPCIPALLPLYLKGQGPSFTGGGGGNGSFSGGGGGSNRGYGGLGGKEYYTCTIPRDGGGPGVTVINSHARLDTVIGGIFLGGGGGASIRLSGSISRAGGNGGGIVLIVTNKLEGNGHQIISDGVSVSTAKNDAGAGGGGAGGSIAITSNSLTNVNVSVRGGKGGNHLDDFGQGGGGGGGLIWFSQSSKPVSVSDNLSGGSEGIDTITVTSNASPGGPGQEKYNFAAQLNGFLFNSIWSSVTGNQVDSICAESRLPRIKGTHPVGGTPGSGYIYFWEKSTNLGVSWTPFVTNTDSINYAQVLPENTAGQVWFRRTVTDHSLPTPITDVSLPVKIKVQPKISNNIIGNSDTVCFAQVPATFISKAVPGGGNGIFAYDWNVKIDNGSYAAPVNTHDQESYTAPSGLTAKLYNYRRKITSGRCKDSTAVVTITVLDNITNNNILNTPPDICFGTSFNNLKGSVKGDATNPLKGGDNKFRYRWESNINNSGWIPAQPVNTDSIYNPVEQAMRSPYNEYFYRRVVYSGSNNVCTSTSNIVTFKDYPVISNNKVTAIAAVCSGTVPPAVTGSVTTSSIPLAGGNGTYTYAWQDSSKVHSWSTISGATNSDYQPGTLSDTTSYRRIVNSANCTDISKSVRIIVHKPVLNNIITLLAGGTAQTICNGQIPSPVTGTIPTGGTNIAGDYAYLWQYSSDDITYTSVTPGGTTQNYAPSAPSATIYFRRNAISGVCTVSSQPVKITVLPVISNNILTGKQRVCFSRIPDPITSAALTGGSGAYAYFWEQSIDGGSTWIPAAGTNSSLSYQPPALMVHTWYRRTVLSGVTGPCSNISPSFDISIDPLPASSINAGPDTMIISPMKVYTMKAVSPISGETGAWRNLNSGKSTFEDTTKYNSIVRNLALGNNAFLWIISRGNCSLKDSVSINLLKNFIPDGFSPNGDAYNNTFKIDGLYLEDNFVDLNIVNGAGTEVFSSTNRNSQKWTDWDGKNSKGLDLPEGTYYYMLKITPMKSGSSVYKRSGFIILKRY
jgi:gliding motility-associated-like protein